MTSQTLVDRLNDLLRESAPSDPMERRGVELSREMLEEVASAITSITAERNQAESKLKVATTALADVRGDLARARKQMQSLEEPGHAARPAKRR